MNNTKYVELSSPLQAELINESKEISSKYKNNDNTAVIFVRIIENSNPFKNWVLSIEDIKQVAVDDNQSKLIFGYDICRVPRNVTEEFIDNNRDQLTNLMIEIFDDICKKSDRIANTENTFETPITD